MKTRRIKGMSNLGNSEHSEIVEFDGEQNSHKYFCKNYIEISIRHCDNTNAMPTFKYVHFIQKDM
jgi:hypothetical protein